MQWIVNQACCKLKMHSLKSISIPSYQATQHWWTHKFYSNRTHKFYTFSIDIAIRSTRFGHLKGMCQCILNVVAGSAPLNPDQRASLIEIIILTERPNPFVTNRSLRTRKTDTAILDCNDGHVRTTRYSPVKHRIKTYIVVMRGFSIINIQKYTHVFTHTDIILFYDSD